MSEWTPPLSYLNQSYRQAYARAAMYQPGPEQSQGSLNTWGEAGASDSSNNNDGVRQARHSAGGASPPDSPEEQGPRQFPDSDVSSPGAPEEGPLLPNEANTASLNTEAIVAPHAANDSTSDAETCVSPESWRSCNSKESLPQMDPATSAQNPNNETSKKSPDASTSRNELKTNDITEKESTDNTEPETEPLISPNESSATLPKAKARVAFSESQMKILVRRFMEKKYLTPAEMRNVAKKTGLTYKQVKTWFQNRRMKLRRDQKDTSWVNERYSMNFGPIYGGHFNIPPHMQHYQGDAQPQLQDQSNQKMMGAPFKTPENLTFYLATMGAASPAAGQPAWQPCPNPNAMATRPQATGWSMPPGSSHYKYNPNAFNPSNVPANTLGYDAGFEIKNGEP